MADKHTTIELLHIASQYLAAAGISVVPKKDDDSHTNLGWSIKRKCLITRTFCNNEALALSVDDFVLEWICDNEIQSRLVLDGLYHQDVLKWIDKMVKGSIEEIDYKYLFHYDLPYCKMESDFRYEKPVESEIKAFSELLNVAHMSFTRFLEANNLASEIRVWPHHFDLGIYTTIDSKSSFAIGAGLAIPDTVFDDCYYYVSGWQDGQSISVESMNNLEIGKWKTDGFNGAVLAASGIEEKDVLSFINGALNQYKSVMFASK